MKKIIGNFIRLWDLRDHPIEPLYMLNNSKTSEFGAPLTSFPPNHYRSRFSTMGLKREIKMMREREREREERTRHQKLELREP